MGLRPFPPLLSVAGASIPGTNATQGDRMPSSYSDVQRAVRVEKFRIWFGWLAGTLVLLFAWRTVSVFSKLGGNIAAVIAGVLFVLLTVTAYRMLGALNRRADRERRQVLGEDYPG